MPVIIQLKFRVTATHSCSLESNMPSLSKEQLAQKIRDFGENPPSQWGRTQLEARLVELKEERGATIQDQQKKMVARMNQAAKKKVNLQQFMRDELKQDISGHETIPVLLAMGTKAIMMNFIPQGSDLMGFGKHSQQTYKFVLQNDLDYVGWCIMTAAEGSVNWRMERFLAWVHQEGNPAPMIPTEVVNKLLKYPKNSQGPNSGYTSSSNTEGSFRVIPSGPLMDKWNPEDDETAEDQVKKLEDQIREIRRSQALARKDPTMLVDSENPESPEEKTRRK